MCDQSKFIPEDYFSERPFFWKPFPKTGVFARSNHSNGRWNMSDDKTQRSPQDAARIAMGEDYEVQYWTGKFGVTRDRLQQAVDAVGNGADAVERHLQA
jgi:hypothetical protein